MRALVRAAWQVMESESTKQNSPGPGTISVSAGSPAADHRIRPVSTSMPIIAARGAANTGADDVAAGAELGYRFGLAVFTWTKYTPLALIGVLPSLRARWPGCKTRWLHRSWD
jgi:hypothetical protein